MQHAINAGKVPAGETNGRSLLTSEDIKAIRVAYDNKATKSTELAKTYGVSQQTICDIGKRRSWRHLP